MTPLLGGAAPARRRSALLVLGAMVLPGFAGAGPAGAQATSPLRVRHQGEEVGLSVVSARGYAALRASRFESLGWSVERTPMGVVLTGPVGTRVVVRDGTPLVGWEDAPVQLAHAPYFDDGELHVPLQLATDFLPWKFPDGYRFVPDSMLMVWESPARVIRSALASAPPLVIIDAGHGGRDPGKVGRGGVREKDVALGIAQALAEVLRERGVDVVLIRDDDTFVPIWDRGALGTEKKGERPGIFVSIHANAFTNDARGFETYFLSEARTEDERRVAALENAPLGVEAPTGVGVGADDLDFILRELKNLDQQHWSSLLAEMVQAELARIHPGPNRGVKQGPLAVLTNAIMPAVLVEIGFLSHPEEARLLSQSSFQAEAGLALARAIESFLERYPPGTASGAGARR
jgi:N-acetylmuramoyl-L-alanine amidase